MVYPSSHCLPGNIRPRLTLVSHTWVESTGTMIRSSVSISALDATSKPPRDLLAPPGEPRSTTSSADQGPDPSYGRGAFITALENRTAMGSWSEIHTYKQGDGLASQPRILRPAQCDGGVALPYPEAIMPRHSGSPNTPTPPSLSGCSRGVWARRNIAKMR